MAWNPNTDPSVAGYNLYYGGASRTYTNVINVGSTTNVMIVNGLVEGKTYYFAVTAYTFEGSESDFSDEIHVYGAGVDDDDARRDVWFDPCRFDFRSLAANWYELQQSTDLVHWTTVWQTTGSRTSGWNMTRAINAPGAQFYRVVLHCFVSKAREFV